MQFTTILSLVASVSLASLASATVLGSCPSPSEHSGTIFLTDRTDCNVFYICGNDGPVKFNCAAGLHFSPSTWVCDYPVSAGVSLASLASATVLGSCPSRSEHTGTIFLTDKTDCNAFYICGNDGPVKFTCAYGLAFSPTRLVCDYPANAGCRK
ncbi:hypothetical protein BZA05DRAFT_444073 [Tricharina praecox]|uniref:uncharacterized protein n=1 Tax=Tricharina praecox TaxID=43433 RepID=UPI00221F3E8B|nr:uncharacterized protein BZA05DRAFT_444073 [Tricharina praecox]KAI5853790.1 hypothetical protein BZA05DRAFT_444073 [Tricharina praecox]